MASAPEPRPGTILIDDRVLDIFARNAERQKTMATFILGALAGTVYGAVVAYLSIAC